MHLSFTSPRVDPWGTNREPSGIGTVLVLIFFFPCRGGELFSFGNDFAGPWGHTHGICASFCQQYTALDQNSYFGIFVRPEFFGLKTED